MTVTRTRQMNEESVGVNARKPDSLAENWGWLEEEQQEALAQVGGCGRVSSPIWSRVYGPKPGRRSDLQLVTEGFRGWNQGRW